MGTYGLKIVLSKADGTLLSVKNKKGKVSLSGGPVPAGAESKITGTQWENDAEGNFAFEISTDNYPAKMTWTLHKNGLLKLEASPLRKGIANVDFIGISFNYPEEKCTGLKWMGRGPYRCGKTG